MIRQPIRAKNAAGAPLVVAPIWVVQPDKAEVGHQPARGCGLKTLVKFQEG